MRKFLPIALLSLSSALGVAGCGTIHATSQAAGDAVSEAAPIDAALVTPGFGWVLTADKLLVSQDGGATFTDAGAPVPRGASRAAFFRDARNGYVTAATGDVITTARTSDGGRTWRTETLRDPSSPAVGYGNLRVTFGDAAHGVILAQTSSSAMSSQATLFATEDGGTSWTARKAPVAGDVAMEPGGRIWLAGGVAGDQLRSSTDQGRRWASPKIQLNGTVGSKAISPPRQGVLPVTVVTGTDRTEVALLTTPDKGLTWRETNRVPVQGRTGPGVRVPVPLAGSGPVVLDTAGAHAYRAAARRDVGPAATDVGPAGLPEGVHTAGFATDGRSGWALATFGHCASGKSDCSLYNSLVATTDGGATWHQLHLWQQKLN